LKTVVSGTYVTPNFGDHNGWDKYVSVALRDWQIGALLQYQSGQLITVPNSTNNLTTQLRITPPANFGAGYNPWNYVPGSPYYVPGFDPNGNFDPRKYNPSNPTDPAVASLLAGGFTSAGTCPTSACAWSNPAPGNWGTTAPYLNGYRWRRLPSESFNFGRNFRFGKEARYVLNVRAEFTNIFNRQFYAMPVNGNPSAPITTTTQNGLIIPTGGYGVVNTLNGNGSQPRKGTIVARLTF
jgi:hypothetical protein